MYKITVEKLTIEKNEINKYDTYERVFEQLIPDISIKELVVFINTEN